MTKYTTIQYHFESEISVIPYIPAKSLPYKGGTGSLGAKNGPLSPAYTYLNIC